MTAADEDVAGEASRPPRRRSGAHAAQPGASRQAQVDPAGEGVKVRASQCPGQQDGLGEVDLVRQNADHPPLHKRRISQPKQSHLAHPPGLSGNDHRTGAGQAGKGTGLQRPPEHLGQHRPVRELACPVVQVFAASYVDAGDGGRGRDTGCGPDRRDRGVRDASVGLRGQVLARRVGMIVTGQVHGTGGQAICCGACAEAAGCEPSRPRAWRRGMRPWSLAPGTASLHRYSGSRHRQPARPGSRSAARPGSRSAATLPVSRRGWMSAARRARREIMDSHVQATTIVTSSRSPPGA